MSLGLNEEPARRRRLGMPRLARVLAQVRACWRALRRQYHLEGWQEPGAALAVPEPLGPPRPQGWVLQERLYWHRSYRAPSDG